MQNKRWISLVSKEQLNASKYNQKLFGASLKKLIKSGLKQKDMLVEINSEHIKFIVEKPDGYKFIGIFPFRKPY